MWQTEDRGSVRKVGVVAGLEHERAVVAERHEHVARGVGLVGDAHLHLSRAAQSLLWGHFGEGGDGERKAVATWAACACACVCVAHHLAVDEGAVAHARVEL